MSRKARQNLKSAEALHIFAKNLLSSSMLGVEMLLHKLKDQERSVKLCNILIDKEIEKPSILVACGASGIFGANFNKVVLQKHDMRLGKTVQGLPYSMSSLMNKKESYEFMYKDFYSGNIVKSSIASEIQPVEKWPYEVLNSDNNLIFFVVINYIFAKIAYNEQLFRVEFMNNVVTKCEELIAKLRNKYFKSRSARITQEILLLNNNYKCR